MDVLDEEWKCICHGTENISDTHFGEKNGVLSDKKQPGSNS